MENEADQRMEPLMVTQSSQLSVVISKYSDDDMNAPPAPKEAPELKIDYQQWQSAADKLKLIIEELEKNATKNMKQPCEIIK